MSNILPDVYEQERMHREHWACMQPVIRLVARWKMLNPPTRITFLPDGSMKVDEPPMPPGLVKLIDDVSRWP